MSESRSFHPITAAPTDTVVEVIHGKSALVVLALWDAERQVWFRIDDPLRRALHRVTGWRPWVAE
jgi:hypothetical protein